VAAGGVNDHRIGRMLRHRLIIPTAVHGVRSNHG
jgi:hypothetical protein